MRRYIRHFFTDVWTERTGRSVGDCRMLSVGCGNGCVERMMIDEMGLLQDHLECFDVSPFMTRIAQEGRGLKSARVGDALQMSPEGYGVHDLVFAGLNVYQHLPHDSLDIAFERAAQCTKPGGYFLSDFVTSDHVCCYPNLMRSANGKTASLRSASVVEDNQEKFLESHTVDITWDTTKGTLHINDAGVQRSWLASRQRIMDGLRKYYSSVCAFDAYSLKQLSESTGTCPSTRYFVIAVK